MMSPQLIPTVQHLAPSHLHDDSVVVTICLYALLAVMRGPMAGKAMALGLWSFGCDGLGLGTR